MSDIIIRDTRLEDIKEMTIVRQNVWSTTYRGIYDDELIDHFDYKTAELSFREKLNRVDTMFAVALDGTKIIGYICFGKAEEKYKDYEYVINYLHILKPYQGQGLGRRFFNIVLDYAKEKGISKFYVSCNKYNYGAQSYYEKMGGMKDYVDKDLNNKKNEQVIYIYEVGGIGND